VLIAIDEDSRISLYVFPFWAALLLIGYQVLKTRKPEAVVPHGHDHVHARSGD
jgi:amino acid transporter, AAT family